MLMDSHLKHFRKADPVIADLIKRFGPYEPKQRRGRFQVLTSSIISQQISTSAARSIRKRLVDRLKPGVITAPKLAALSVDELRELGISRQKGEYLLDLAEHVNDGRVSLRRMSNMDDDQVIEQLTQVRGIGVWTAQMFLMSSLDRRDVFPFDDLGIRNAIKSLYDLDDMPTKAQGKEISDPWRPYRTVACWYCWRSLDG